MRECDHLAGLQNQQNLQAEPSPEDRIATMVQQDFGVRLSPQAIRMFIRLRWARVSKAAHEIHDA
jgi:hypothetical protein